MNVYLLSAAAWAFPGLGHFLLGKWLRGLLIAVSCVSLILIGWQLGGTYFLTAETDKSYGNFMYWFHQLSDLGNGVFFLVHSFTDGKASPSMLEQALKSPMFEYGVRFLSIAGLLNFLAILDVVDISRGTKE